jgi:transposase
MMVELDGRSPAPMAHILLLPDPTVLALVSVEVNEEAKMITATAQTTSREANCPVCGYAADRVHSHYIRTLGDLPCSGQRVRWLIQVRRFWCENRACKRVIFTERLPTCAPAHARRTEKQAEALCEIAFALGGKAGERIAKLLSMKTSHDTLLRLMQRTEPSTVIAPRILGLDDFAWKKGDRYGTLLIDQEAHKVVDVLPDREAETIARWLVEHPGVQIISRDRAGAYADGARKGAPHARQIADRFHLLVNLHDAMVRLFERKHEILKAVVTKEQAQNQGTEKAGSSQEKNEPKPLTTTEAQRQARRARRKDRYEEVITLHKQGMSQVAIATLVGLNRNTVYSYIQAPEFVEQVRPNRHKSKLDPYKDYLLHRLEEAQPSVTDLIKEIREQGFHGSDTIVFDYLRSVRGDPGWREAYLQRKKQIARGVSRRPLSAHQAAWLFVSSPRKLKWRQIWWQLEPLRVEDEELGRTYHLAQDFRTMITQRQVAVLPRWLKEVEESGIPELRSLAAGIYRDYDAVYGALETTVSNGQTEAQVHRLKLIKRQAYGRASFQQLRLRVLHGSGVTYQEKLQLEHSSQQKCV